MSVVQATLLILEIEPQEWGDFVDNNIHRPDDYDAVKSSLLTALRSGEINGRIAHLGGEPLAEAPASEIFEDYRQCDVHNTFIKVSDLKTWLIEKGHKKGYFFPSDEQVAAYLNPDHIRYAPKLAAAVSAWQSFDAETQESGTPKQRMQKWLHLNAPKFELINNDGKPNESAIKEISSVANWNRKGGAPKKSSITTLSQEKLSQGFSRDFD